jgi:hypothetical protein
MNHIAQIRALQEALDTVTVNAQALAAADLCLGTLLGVRDQLNGWFASVSPDRSLVDARDRINGAISDVQLYRQDMAGMPASPVDGGAWDNLRHAISRGYNLLWAVQDVQGDVDTGWGGFFSWLGDTAAGSVEAMPGVISSVVGYTGTLVTDTAGGVVSGVLKGFWPVLLIAGVAAVAAVGLFGAPAVARAARVVI